LPAHQTGHPDGAAFVCNYEHLGREGDSAPVEHGDCFSRVRAPHGNAPAKIGEVVGVHGLTQLEQHVVRHINQRAHRADARVQQALAHPAWGGDPIVDAANDACDKLRACARRGEPDRQRLLVLRRHRRELRSAQRPAAQRRNLAGDAEHRHRIAAIWCDVELENEISRRGCLERLELKARHRQARAHLWRLPRHVDPLLEPPV
jgi:hypothetical protein